MSETLQCSKAADIAKLQERSEAQRDSLLNMEKEIKELKQNVTDGFDAVRKQMGELSTSITTLKTDKQWGLWIFGGIVAFGPTVVNFILQHLNTQLFK